MESPEALEMSGGCSGPSVTSALEGREVLRTSWIAKPHKASFGFNWETLHQRIKVEEK